jgi:hypothetical protein
MRIPPNEPVGSSPDSEKTAFIPPSPEVANRIVVARDITPVAQAATVRMRRPAVDHPGAGSGEGAVGTLAWSAIARM